MIRSAKALLLAASVCFTCLAQSAKPQTAAKPPATAPNNAPDDKAGAYYHFAMGRLYALMAGAEGSKEDVSKAIQHYQAALKLDPNAGIIFEELTDLYIQSGRFQDAVTQAEDLLKQNPDNIDARRMLGRIYTRMIGGNPQDGKINETFLRQAIDQYQKITQKDPKDAESWVILGRLYRVSNNSPESEKAFNAALKLEPDNEEALTGLATLYLDLGDTKAAIDKLKAVTDKAPSERTLGALAKAYEDVQNYKAAAEALQRALAIAPDDTRLTRELAEDLLYSDQVDESLKLYLQLAADEPRVPDYQLRLSQIYRVKGDFAKAHDALNKAKQADAQSLGVRDEEVALLEAEHKYTEAIAELKGILDETARKNYSETEKKMRVRFLEKLGNDYKSAEQYPQAIEAFRQIATLDSDAAPQATVLVAQTYQAQKDNASALRETEAGLKKFPKDRMLVLQHASLLADMNKIDQAAAEMRTLLGGKQDRGVYLEIAQLYEKGKRWKEMSQSLDEAEKLSPSPEDKENVYFMRGAMLERQKRFDAAEAEFRKVLNANPQHAGAMNYLGYMLADRNVRLDEAYQLIKKALELEPDNGAYLDSLGWVYYRQGKLSEAEDLLQRAIQHQPDPTVHDHLGDVYLKEGKIRDAIAQWQASLKEFKKQPDSSNDPEELSRVNKKLDDAQAKLARQDH
jgi:tetratricopeptide (TPR) repeat protein